MNDVIGFTSLAQSHIDDKEQVRDYLSKIMTSSQHLLSLINDVLDMSQIENGSVTIDESPLSISKLLQDIRTITQNGIDSKGLNFYIDTQDITAVSYTHLVPHHQLPSLMETDSLQVH